jgi:hypothetical protein
MAYGKRLLPDAIRSSAFGAIGAAYTAVGAAFANPVRILLLQNLTDAGVLITFNPVRDEMVVPANGFILLDIMCNKSNDGGTFIAQGTTVYVKRLSGAPTSGSFYVSTFYCLGD